MRRVLTPEEKAAANLQRTINLTKGRGRKGRAAQAAMSRMHHKSSKEARAVTFLTERVVGRTIKQIATLYECHEQTVSNYLRYAKDHNLVAGYARSQILTKLVPMAMAVVQTHLEDGNLEAAQDVLYGLGILQKQSNIKHTSDDSESLDAIRAQYLRGKERAVDAVIIDKNQLALPLYTEADDPDQPFNEQSQPFPRRKPVVPDQDSEDE